MRGILDFFFFLKDAIAKKISAAKIILKAEQQ